EAIHFENFQPAETDENQVNTDFEVELDGETYEDPADRSIVEVLNEAGCDIDTSCEEGICGTCIMEVLSGVPEHRDSVLTKSEREAGETMANCVSRTKDPKLVLDYFKDSLEGGVLSPTFGEQFKLPLTCLLFRGHAHLVLFDCIGDLLGQLWGFLLKTNLSRSDQSCCMDLTVT